MCFSTPTVAQATAPSTPAPPPAPPQNAPSAPVINTAVGTATDGMTPSTGARRGASSLTIGLGTPGAVGNGLMVPS